MMANRLLPLQNMVEAKSQAWTWPDLAGKLDIVIDDVAESPLTCGVASFGRIAASSPVMHWQLLPINQTAPSHKTYGEGKSQAG
jgi:hypothetical protein